MIRRHTRAPRDLAPPLPPRPWRARASAAIQIRSYFAKARASAVMIRASAKPHLGGQLLIQQRNGPPSTPNYSSRSQEIVSLTPAEHLGSEDQVMIMGVDREGVLKIKNAAAWKKNLSVQFSEEEQAPKKMKEDLTKGLEEPCKQKLKSEALGGFDDAADPVKMMLDSLNSTKQILQTASSSGISSPSSSGTVRPQNCQPPTKIDCSYSCDVSCT